MGYLLIVGIIFAILYLPIGVSVLIWSNNMLMKSGNEPEHSFTVIFFWPLYLILMMIFSAELAITRAKVWQVALLLMCIFVLYLYIT